MKLRKEYKIGLVIALALAGLIWGVPFLKGTGIFSNQKRVYAIYSRVDGISPSSSITINGLTIGQVEKLDFIKDRSGRIVATMLIDGKVFIPKHSIAKIASIDLLGGKAIQIIFSNNTEGMQDGDTLKSLLEAGLMDGINEQIGPIKDKTVSILTSVDSMLTVLKVVFKDGSINNTIKNVEKIAVNLNNLIGDEKQRLADIFANVNAITKNLKNNGDQISKAIQNFELISDSLAKSHLAGTINHAGAAIAQLQATLEKVNSGKGSLALLVNDDKLYNNLSSSSKDLDSLLIDMKTNPHRYVHFSVFGGKSGNPKKTKK